MDPLRHNNRLGPGPITTGAISQQSMMQRPNLPGPAINSIVTDSEEPLPSLSDGHDYEPQLEFDDTELEQAPDPAANFFSDDMAALQLADEEFTSGDFNAEPADESRENLQADDYEEQLSQQSEKTELTAMEELAKLRFIDFCGPDRSGHYVFAIYACRLPTQALLGGTTETLTKYIIHIMRQYVENDYSIVYFHQGLKDDNKPPAAFLWAAYKELDRSFKKNLKQLFVVHPTWWIRGVWYFFRSFVSVKFKNKIIYTSSLAELRQSLGINHLNVPQNIVEFDDKLNRTQKSGSGIGGGPFGRSVTAGRGQSDDTPLPESQLPRSTQFGVSLKFITANSPCLNYIPPVVRKCVDSMSLTGVIDTEGIFRRSGAYTEVAKLKKRVNAGEMEAVDFKAVDTHVLAGLLKTFLRDLSEPLLTFELYDEIVKFRDWSNEARARNVKQLLRERLPIENYELFKYLIEFLVKVMECKDLNKMTASNLAIVFGPNLVWSRDVQASLQDIGPINAFVEWVLVHHEDIYLVDINQQQLRSAAEPAAD